jgi:hypothetical protein
MLIPTSISCSSWSDQVKSRRYVAPDGDWANLEMASCFVEGITNINELGYVTTSLSLSLNQTCCLSLSLSESDVLLYPSIPLLCSLYLLISVFNLASVLEIGKGKAPVLFDLGQVCSFQFSYSRIGCIPVLSQMFGWIKIVHCLANWIRSIKRWADGSNASDVKCDLVNYYFPYNVLSWVFDNLLVGIRCWVLYFY